MRVFVAGATGVLGRRVVRQLVARGHVAVGLTRSESGDATVRSLGGEPRRADLFDADALARAAEGCSVVIHAATAIPTKVRTRPKDWDMNDRIRREGTRALTTAAGRVGAGAYLQQSVVWAVRGPEGALFDEDAPAAGDPILASALEGERIARDAGAKHGFRRDPSLRRLLFGGRLAHEDSGRVPFPRPSRPRRRRDRGLVLAARGRCRERVRRGLRVAQTGRVARRGRSAGVAA